MKKLIFIIPLFIILNVKIHGQISVIVNKSVKETSVNPETLSDIYSLSDVKWSNGSKIVVFEQAGDSDTKAKFYKYISKEPLALKKEWLKKQFAGEAKAPETVSSDEEMINKVASTPGSIGYVQSSSVDGNVIVLIEIK